MGRWDNWAESILREGGIEDTVIPQDMRNWLWSVTHGHGKSTEEKLWFVLGHFVAQRNIVEGMHEADAREEDYPPCPLPDDMVNGFILHRCDSCGYEMMVEQFFTYYGPKPPPDFNEGCPECRAGRMLPVKIAIIKSINLGG